MNGKSADFSDYGFLIADDQAFLRDIIQTMLARCRARKIEHASNGAEAMRVLADKPDTVDCVLCDWNMEPVNGLEVLRSIRAGRVHNTPRDFRVIMLTGHADEPVVRAALAMGASGYLVKPVSMDKLVQAVDWAFGTVFPLQPAAAYETIENVDLPGGDLDTSAKRVPPWVLWSAMRSGERRNWVERLEKIRGNVPNDLAPWANTNRLVVNKQRMDLDSISAGKVLAEDVFTEEGHLLLAFGTELTESLLKRLRELADDSAVKAQLIVGDLKD